MKVVFNIKSLKTQLVAFKSNHKKVGLVPTMGALHQGHISLVTKALEQTEVVVVSIFVNPTQFNNLKDLEQYPNTLEADTALLKKCTGNLIVFAPSISEMYPNGPEVKTYNFNGLEKLWEGADRPGHFNGVGTVVETFLNIVTPDYVYFGEKDFQQLAIVKQLVTQLNIATKIIGCSIVREANGLAMSSRNERLSNSHRAKASVLYRTLKWAVGASKNTPLYAVKKEAVLTLESNHGLKVHYFEFVSSDRLLPIQKAAPRAANRLIAAVSYGGVRLLDNIAV